MRKVIGIGETILDIIFKDSQPVKAVPGGSTFNCMVSLARCGIPACFISELGNDRVGKLIRDFMKKNRLSDQYLDIFENRNSPVALAFLDENQNASYSFYNDFPDSRLNSDFPEINENDIVVFGSYFALNPALRDRMQEFLSYARQQNAILYYDINFRSPHAHDRIKLMPVFLENFEYASIVRCSHEDLSNLYPGKSIEAVYQDHIAYHCSNLIVTQGKNNILLKTSGFNKSYVVTPTNPVSSIGAGDNFNAGLVYALMKYQSDREQIKNSDESFWDKLIDLGKRFAGEVCMSFDNYVSDRFGNELT